MKKRIKNRSKIIKYIILILLFVGFGVVLALRQKPNDKRLKSLTSDNKSNISADRTIISGVEVNDFLKGLDENANYIRIDQTPDYHIFFIPDQELITISITSYPFDKHRPIAEDKLLEKLGVSESEACKLNVDITTPSYANPDKAGRTYTLSFCNQ